MPLGGIGLRDLDAALGETEPAHAMRQPGWTKPDLGDLESLPFAEKHVLGRDLETIEFNLAMPAMFLRSHDRDAAQDAPTRLVAVEQESGEPVARIVRGARDENEMGRLGRARDEPLPARSRVDVAMLLRARQHHRGVGAAAGMRLGHGEGGAHFAAGDRGRASAPSAPPFRSPRGASCCRRRARPS